MRPAARTAHQLWQNFILHYGLGQVVTVACQTTQSQGCGLLYTTVKNTNEGDMSGDPATCSASEHVCVCLSQGQRFTLDTVLHRGHA